MADDAAGDGPEGEDDASAEPREPPANEVSRDPAGDAVREASGKPVRPREAGGAQRRWLIRVLVGLGIGIPVALEAGTFLGLLGKHLGGGADTPTPTPEGRVVGVGDELLPATPPAETLTEAVIEDTGGDTWSLQVVVQVENTGEAGYGLRLGDVTTEGGETVSGGGATGEVAPGETATLRASWSLPAGATPRTLAVVGVTYGDDGTTSAVREDVRLANVPVQG